ncbi:hypothetical protein HID58_076271 [Brassica napus]|uniref:RNase H type-1 domain-containing protein n=1 Tax=Brassica napus TaxID=3708 RepID=A0ABQ7YNA1_BRANA|nr:hypothetical protein HID58_076271 [Brassica napus]
MALQYISHSDPTERQARITRVKQSFQPGFEDNVGRAPRISHDINKGKGHVFNFQEQDRPGKRAALASERPAFSKADIIRGKDRDGFLLDNLEASSSSSSLGPTVFRVGTYTGNFSTGANEAVKKSRRRPQRWKRICSQRPTGQKGVEEIVKLGWGVDTLENETPLLERINRTDEVDLTLKVSDLIDERYGTWDAQRVRMGSWNAANVGDKEDIDENTGGSALPCWQKPCPSFIKCNIGSSWIDANRNCGVAWLTRNHCGAPLIHSRCSYSMVASSLEAELFSFLWAAESISTLRHENVVFESTSYLAGEAVLSRDNFPQFRVLIDTIREKLSRLQLWSLAYVHSEANRCADAIARSVTRDHRYASYIEKGGPSWLLPMIRADVVDTVNGY